nr:hypothetical protein [Candidatus Sigynarchaeota archaeon]
MSCNLENNQPPVEWHATLITSTKGTAIIIVGFNCRPLAERCTMAGFRPVVIDYFGDADIRQHAAEGHYFLQESQDPRDGDHFRSWALATLERVVSKQPGPGKPMILAGSGFDDEPSCWKRFNELGFLLGNSAMAVQRARNLVAIGSLLKNNGIGIEIPRTTRVSITPDTGVDGLVQEICKKLKFPIVMKQTRTAGGSGIEFMENEASLSKFLAKASDENSGDAGDAKVYNAQEFVGDGDARDISVIACNDRVVCKTRQIIGEARLHAPKRFSYCGNEIPLEP